jgi:hypothetical protein
MAAAMPEASVAFFCSSAMRAPRAARHSRKRRRFANGIILTLFEMLFETKNTNFL